MQTCYVRPFTTGVAQCCTSNACVLGSWEALSALFGFASMFAPAIAKAIAFASSVTAMCTHALS